MKNSAYEIANSEFWYLVEHIFDFVLCFEISSGKIIRKSGFDKVCTTLDKHTDYYNLMNEYKDSYVSDLSLIEFTEKTSNAYIKENPLIEFIGLEFIEAQELRWYSYTIVTKENIGTILIKDVHELKLKENQLLKMLTIDQMTGFLNRVSFDDFIDDKVDNTKNPFTILFIDIDDFKKVNDTLGHLIGDELLREFSSVLNDTLKNYATIGRYGGDEFIACIDKISTHDDLVQVITTLFNKLSHELKCGVKISISVGISLYPLNGLCRKELYHSADTALYEVKRKGKNNYIFSNNIANGDMCEK